MDVALHAGLFLRLALPRGLRCASKGRAYNETWFCQAVETYLDAFKAEPAKMRLTLLRVVDSCGFLYYRRDIPHFLWVRASNTASMLQIAALACGYVRTGRHRVCLWECTDF